MENLRQMLDDIDEATVANIFGGMPSYHTPDGVMLEPKEALPLRQSSYTSTPDRFNAILLKKGSAFTIDDGVKVRRIVADQDITINPKAMLDVNIGKESGLTELEHGADYYIYAYVAGNTSNAIDIVVSKNSTYPDDKSGSSPYTASNTRKIGGFHFGTVRVVSQNGSPVDSSGVEFGATSNLWKQNVIKSMVVPNSIWDLCDTDGGRIPHRDGTVMIGGSWKSSNEGNLTGHYSKKGGRFWCDIYLVSKDSGKISFSKGSTMSPVKGNGKLVSAYGKMPITGSEGLCGYNFIELAKKDGLRLLSYHDWLQVAYGNPQGEDNDDNYGWTKTTNTARTYTGCSVNTSDGSHSAGGVKKYALSAWNVCDCVGNVQEWLSDFAQKGGTGTYNWQDAMPNAECGKIFADGLNNLTQFLAGFYWKGGTSCGCRALNLNFVPWQTANACGSRFARDAL